MANFLLIQCFIAEALNCFTSVYAGYAFDKYFEYCEKNGIEKECL